MNQDQLDRIARLLNRISDRSERDEIAREVGRVLSEAEPNFDSARFYDLAGIEAPGESGA